MGSRLRSRFGDLCTFTVICRIASSSTVIVLADARRLAASAQRPDAQVIY
jgi:hypothetical protein